MGEKNELKTATCMLGGEKPKDQSCRIIDLYSILRRRAQNAALASWGARAPAVLGSRVPRVASHSRLPGRLTRDYKADQVAISGNSVKSIFPIFS